MAAANGWPIDKRVHIGNAHFAYTNVSDTYRLIISELTSGIFVVDFTFNKVRDSISITAITYINLNDELNEQGFHMPSNAYYQAITVLDEYYSIQFGYWEIDLLITTHNFHTLQVGLHVSKNGQVLSNETQAIH